MKKIMIIAAAALNMAACTKVVSCLISVSYISLF